MDYFHITKKPVMRDQCQAKSCSITGCAGLAKQCLGQTDTSTSNHHAGMLDYS